VFNPRPLCTRYTCTAGDGDGTSSADLAAADVLLDQLEVPGRHGDGGGRPAMVAPRRRPRLLLAAVLAVADLPAGVGRRVHVERGQVVREHEHALRPPSLVAARPIRRHPRLG
jgi:hypothetical protein